MRLRPRSRRHNSAPIPWAHLSQDCIHQRAVLLHFRRKINLATTPQPDATNTICYQPTLLPATLACILDPSVCCPIRLGSAWPQALHAANTEVREVHAVRLSSPHCQIEKPPPRILQSPIRAQLGGLRLCTLLSPLKVLVTTWNDRH